MHLSVLRPVLLLTATTACLAPKLKADFETDLKRWVGRPCAEFIQYRGNPQEAKPRPGGGMVYVFEANKGLSSSRDPVRFANPNGSLGEVSMRMGSSPQYCRLILETDAAGTILTTRWEGNDCW